MINGNLKSIILYVGSLSRRCPSFLLLKSRAFFCLSCSYIDSFVFVGWVCDRIFVLPALIAYLVNTSMKPIGNIHSDLPSPYQAHPCGLLHLPRFIAKIRKHLAGELNKEYQRNFTKGFDGFLCLHLGVDPQGVIAAVRESDTEEVLNQRLNEIFPKELNAHVWNRKLVQMGMSEMGQAKLREVKAEMEIADRDDLICFADIIDTEEGRIEA